MVDFFYFSDEIITNLQLTNKEYATTPSFTLRFDGLLTCCCGRVWDCERRGPGWDCGAAGFGAGMVWKESGEH